MALSWCKVASNLDSNPKIRKAGRLGREVFLFALRRNAEPNNRTPGRLSKEDLEPEYISHQLMMNTADAQSGVVAACHAGLLREEQDCYVIVAWGDVWGRGSGGSADRMAKHRENKKIKRCDAAGDSGDARDRHSDRSDIEERRGDKMRTSQVDADLTERLLGWIIKNNPRHKASTLSAAARAELVESWADDIRKLRTLDRRDPAEIRKVIDWCQSDAFWHQNILSASKLRKQWDQLVVKMGSGYRETRVIQQVQPDDDTPPLFILGGKK